MSQQGGLDSQPVIQGILALPLRSSWWRFLVEMLPGWVDAGGRRSAYLATLMHGLQAEKKTFCSAPGTLTPVS